MGKRTISDSMLNAEADCAMRGLVAYRIGLRPETRSTGYRIGAIGHEFMRAVLLGKLRRDDLDPERVKPGTPAGAIVDREHTRNGWLLLDEETYPDARHAAYGAGAALDELGSMTFATGVEGAPMIECKVTAPIRFVAATLADLGYPLDEADIAALEEYAPGGVLAAADGVVARETGHPGGTKYEICDWKFKDQPSTPEPFGVVDPQAALYAIVLRALGFDVDWSAQVHIFARAPSRPLRADELPRRADGLPMLRHAHTTAIAFLEALGGDIEALPVGTAKAPIREKYRAHVEALAAADIEGPPPAVQIVGGYLPPTQAAAITADRLRLLALHVRTGAAMRSLRVYPGSRCLSSARFRCEAQAVCHANLRGQGLDYAIEDALADGHVLVYKDSPAERVEEG